MKQVQRLHSDSIDFQDNRFNFRMIISDESVQYLNSIPLFWKGPNSYIPCTNFGDKKSNLDIDALVYADNLSYEEVMQDLVVHNKLNIFETSNVLNLLEKHSSSFDKVQWSQLLGLPIKEWDKIRMLSGISKDWQEYFVSKNTPLKRIFSFEDPLLRECLESLFPLNPGINILEQIASMLKEISLRDTCSYNEIMQDVKISDVLLGEDVKASSKLQEIRSILFARRYPTISEFRHSLDIKRADVDKLKNLQIGIDENFETLGIELKYLMTSAKDIGNLQTWLNNNKEALKSILDFQKGKS